MGMLGISLLFVGIVLVMNGVNDLTKVDPKSTAIMNIIVAFIIIIGNFIMLAQATTIMDYRNIASGFLFGFTYVFIAANCLLKLDLRPFGWYSLFVAIYAVIMAITSFDSGDIRFCLLWAVWSILWLAGFLELVLKLKLRKIFPYLSIAEGIFATFIPAIFMLTDKW